MGNASKSVGRHQKVRFGKIKTRPDGASPSPQTSSSSGKFAAGQASGSLMPREVPVARKGKANPSKNSWSRRRRALVRRRILEQAARAAGQVKNPGGDEATLTALELARELFGNPNPWLETPNARFDGRRPIDMIGTDEEKWICRVLYAYKYGMF